MQNANSSPMAAKPKIFDANGPMIYEVPGDIMSQILGHLPARDLFALRLTSKTMKQHANQNTLWENLYKSEFHVNIPDEEESTESTSSSTSGQSAMDQLREYRMRQQKQFKQKNNIQNFLTYRNSGFGLLVETSSVKKSEYFKLQSLGSQNENAIQAACLFADPQENIVYVGFRSGHINAFNYETNQIVQRYILPAVVQSSGIFSMVIQKDYVCVGAGDGSLLLYPLKNLLLQSYMVKPLDSPSDGANDPSLLPPSLNEPNPEIVLSLESSVIPKQGASTIQLNFLAFDEDFIIAGTKQHQLIQIWRRQPNYGRDNSSQVLLDSITGDCASYNKGKLMIVDGSSMKILQISLNKEQQYERKLLFNTNSIRDAIKIVNPTLEQSTSILCYQCHFEGYIAAALFREKRTKPGSQHGSLSAIKPFDVLIIWNLNQGGNAIPLVQDLSFLNSNVTYFKVDESLNYVICGNTGGRFILCNTTEGKLFFQSEDYIPQMSAVTFTHDRIFMGSQNATVRIISANRKGGKEQMARIEKLVQEKAPLSPEDSFIYFRTLLYKIQQGKSSEEIELLMTQYLKEFRESESFSKAQTENWKLFTEYHQLKEEVQSWKKLALDVNKLDQTMVIDQLYKVSTFQRKLKRFQRIYPKLEISVTAELSALRKRLEELNEIEFQEQEQTFYTMLPLTTNNVGTAERFRASLNNNTCYHKGIKVLQWLEATEVYQKHQTLLDEVDLALGEYYLQAISSDVTRLRSIVGYDLATLENFWEEYDRIQIMIQRHSSSLKKLPTSNGGLTAVDHELNSIYESVSMNLLQQIDSEISIIKTQAREEGITVKDLFKLENRLSSVQSGTLFMMLARRHPTHTANVRQLVTYGTELIKTRIEEVKPLESSLIASIIEELNNFKPPSTIDAVSDAIQKITRQKELLEKYSGSNPDWCKIGMNRADQIIQDLLEPKKPTLTTSDFFDDYEEEEQDEEDFIDEEEEEDYVDEEEEETNDD